MHWTESVDAGELDEEQLAEKLKDHIAELEKETGNIVKLHSIP